MLSILVIVVKELIQTVFSEQELRSIFTSSNVISYQTLDGISRHANSGTPWIVLNSRQTSIWYHTDFFGNGKQMIWASLLSVYTNSE